ncbi:hypothetical protein M3Y94_01239200 [Aphelenchoides besseyi]|nr:hypothetical protein M3Y94_01239200 [Aphelenchoides besseyi]
MSADFVINPNRYRHQRQNGMAQKIVNRQRWRLLGGL